MKKQLKGLLEILAIVLAFILIAFIVQTNLGFFEGLIGENILLGLSIYFFMIILAIVVAPLASIPLIPIVSSLYGWQITAAVSIIGWTVGSVLAFVIARRYGVKIVRKLIPIEQVHRIENKIPEHHLFISVIFLRMVIPVDILSYALGLFSKIKFWPYTIATFIGVIPVTVLLSIIGTIPFTYQLIAFLIAGITIVIGYGVRKRIWKRN